MSPQFSHLPKGSEYSSLWLEVALEGVILYDPMGIMSATLRRIRDVIAEGTFCRKMSHGHPYWVRKELGGAEQNAAFDYIERAHKRLSALKALYQESAWADVVRESQEVVELALKALLRHYHIEVPRIHDVSGILEIEKSRFPAGVQKNIAKYVEISRALRRDRELAFYGSEDLTPREFYKQADADKAKTSAEWIVKTLLPVIV